MRKNKIVTPFVYNDGGRVVAGFKDMRLLKKDPCDCVVRSLAIALNVDYREVHKAIWNLCNIWSERHPWWREFVRKHKVGYGEGWPLTMYNCILQTYGFEQLPLNKIGLYNASDLYDTWSDGSPMFPGIYVVAVPKHLTVIIDGYLHDLAPLDNHRVYNLWYRKGFPNVNVQKLSKLGQL